MILDVWLEGFDVPVGAIERRDDKSLVFAYTAAALADPDHSRISMSLPVRAEPYGDAASAAYFGNLLFEGRELDRVVAQHGIDRDDHGALLHHLGADCPGAISVTPEGTGPGKRPGRFPDDYEELSEGRLAEIVRSLHIHGRLPEGTRDPSPIAGVQPKIATLVRDGRHFLPAPGSRAPTTHILKVSPADDPDLTRYEAALLELARHLGIDTAQSRHKSFDGAASGPRISAILSARFDRVFDGDEIRRVHAEDFCQALGLPRQLKYERDAGAGEALRRFSAAAIGRLCDATAQPGKVRLGFLEQTLFNLAVGNTDNHGKNASILYTTPRGVLAPLYDVVPVVMDRRVTHELAFRIGGASYVEDLDREAVHAMMAEIGIRKPRLEGRWEKLLHRISAEGIPLLHERGGKSLADFVASQLCALEGALGLALEIPDRDYFPRSARDATPAAGGWGGFS
jgi:serine/threonine-protein kinase HipA